MRLNISAYSFFGAAILVLAADATALAQTQQQSTRTSNVFYEAESEYLFGFLDGSDIGNEGEKAFEYELTGAFKKRGGSYSALKQEFEIEYVPTQNFAIELNAHALSHSINSVEGLDDLHGTQFSGASAKLRYLIIGRGPGSPIGLTISAEPEWARVDDVGGTRTQSYASEFRLIADTELIANRLFAVANLIYEPSTAKPADTGLWERSSNIGIGLGFAYRVTPTVAIGAGAEYDRTYGGLLFQTFDGHALFVGPTLQVNFTPKILLAAAFFAQIAGHASDDLRPLDLTNFERYRANVKVEFEF